MPAWRKILVHHSASRDGVVSDYEAIRHQHVVVNGWADVGYHAVLERVGGRVVDRDARLETMQGAHCPGQNQIALGVCLVGNFEIEVVGMEMFDVLVARLAEWCMMYNISPNDIYGHRDFRATLCPGRNLYNLLGTLREKTHEQVDAAR